MEPTTGGDATVELAQEAVARGGRVSLLMVITDRVERDIKAYASSENLSRGEAEAIALDQFRSYYSERLGGEVNITTEYGTLSSDVVKYITADTTAVAIPERLVTDNLVQRIASYSGRPVIVAPNRAALVAV